MKIKIQTFFLTLLLFTMAKNSYAQDWANLSRYQDDNIKLISEGPKKNRVVFMGNSITEGWLKENPEFFANKPYVNRGISGQTSPQMLLRFRTDVISLKPEIVVILAGTNDIAGNTGPSTLEMILNNIASMAELAKANGIKPILCSVVPAFDYWWKPGVAPAEKIVELNKMIRDYAKQMRFEFVDYHSVMKDDKNGLKKEFGEDGVHPNKSGYLVMEPLIEKAISKTLKSK